MQLRHFPIQRKEITRLAYRPNNVDFVNFPLGFTLTRTRIPALTLAHSFTLTWRFASTSRDRDRAERREGWGAGARCVHRHNFVIAVVERRPNQVVHSCIDNRERLRVRSLDLKHT